MKLHTEAVYKTRIKPKTELRPQSGFRKIVKGSRLTYLAMVISSSLVFPCFLRAQIVDPEGKEVVSRNELIEWKMSMDKPLKIGDISVNTHELPAGKKFEMTFELEAAYDNPFDYEQIDVMCEFTGSDGKKIRVPAFFYTSFSGESANDNIKQGASSWKVRFTPVNPGTYKYQVVARNKGVVIKSTEGSMTCIPGKYNGFVRVSKKDPLMFEFDNGEPYLPIGHNTQKWEYHKKGVASGRLVEEMDLLNRLADSGGNYSRIWQAEWAHAVESTAGGSPTSPYLGAGRYQQLSCWEYDKLMEKAEERGIYVGLLLYDANMIANSGKRKKDWEKPYAFTLKVNGGPLDKVEDFWTNAEWTKHVKMRMRYSVARWGYSPNLMMWEFFNELSPEKLESEIAKWHDEMGAFFKRIDPYKHLVSTSSHGVQQKMWGVPGIDVVQVHLYRSDDEIEGLVKDAQKTWKKPFLVGEYGCDFQFDPKKEKWDPKGVYFHNSIWSAGIEKSTAAFWFLKYLTANDLWYHFGNLSKWIKDVRWLDPGLKSITADCAVDASKSTGGLLNSSYSKIKTGPKSFEKSKESSFVVNPDTGQVANVENLQPMLFGSENRKTIPAFILDCKQPAVFKVLIGSSVGGESNMLYVSLDGTKIETHSIPAGKAYGTKSTFYKKWSQWVTPCSKAIEIKMPAGKHELMLEAADCDRFEVSYYIKDYCSNTKPAAIRGWQTQDMAWFWIKNQNSCASFLKAGGSYEQLGVKNLIATVEGLKDGDYDVTWYDTWKGADIKVVKAKSAGGKLEVAVPDFIADIAGSIKPRK